MKTKSAPVFPEFEDLPLEIPEGVPLERWPDGTVRVTGTGVHFWLVARCLGVGATAAEVAANFSSLEIADVATIAGFIAAHGPEVEEHLRLLEKQEQVVTDVLRTWDEAHPNPVIERLRALSRG